MRVEFDPALQSTIDTVLAPKKPRLDRQAHGFAVLAPAALPRSARRVRFSVKYVHSIPHREDDGREPPEWTRIPSLCTPPSPSDFFEDVAIYNDSDDDVEERIYLANIAQNLHVAALNCMANRGDDSDDNDDCSEYLSESDAESDADAERGSHIASTSEHERARARRMR